jgi:ribosomal-protein-alanine N-acetyltransferase
MHVLETERLALRRLALADAPFILELLNDPLFLRFIGDKGVRDLAGAKSYLQQGPLASYAQHGFGLFRVALKDGDVPIGMCGLLKREILADVDIGFAYLPRFGGLGYATEAARATLDYGRTELGLERIVAITAPDNDASQNVLKKIGLRYDRTLKLPAYNNDSYLFVPAGG